MVYITGFATLTGTETLTNKTISLTNNTVSGTTSEFNTALTDGSFTTLAGTETLTNKTLTAPTITAPVLDHTWRLGCRAASTANVDIATELTNGDSLDGVTLATGDRVLLKNQTSASQNGIYDVVSSGAASRSADFDTDAEADRGCVVTVSEGSTNADTSWVLTTNAGITLDTDALAFSAFAIGASSTNTLTNKTIDLDSNTLTGTTAEFNIALQDDSFATLTGSETLTGKTITDANNTITHFQSDAAATSHSPTDTTGHIMLPCSTTTAACTVNLPTAVANTAVFTVYDVDGNANNNNITIDADGSETIVGSATYVISNAYNSVNLFSDGANWYFM